MTFECDNSPGSKPSGVVGARTLHWGLVHSELTGCHVSGLVQMAGYQLGVSSAIEEGMNVTTQPTC